MTVHRGGGIEVEVSRLVVIYESSPGHVVSQVIVSTFTSYRIDHNQAATFFPYLYMMTCCGSCL